MKGKAPERTIGLVIKKTLAIGAALYFTAAMIFFPSQSVLAAQNALAICANALIPSLFPFFVFSSLLIQLGFARIISKPTSRIMPILFGVSGSGALCFLLGILSGYPLGAVCVCDLYREGEIGKNDAESLLAFCNNSGPLFIIGAVGAAMYRSEAVGIMLYTTHILASLSVGIIFGCFNRRNGAECGLQRRSAIRAKPLGVILKDAVAGAVNGILNVCGFTVLFAVIIASVTGFLQPGALKALGIGFLEISAGVHSVSGMQMTLAAQLILTAAIIGFSGMSVHFQVMGIVSKTDLSIKRYFVGKTLQALIAAAYTAAALHMFLGDADAVSCCVYPVKPYEMLDFAGTLKLSVLYTASAAFIIFILWLFEKVRIWQKKTKYKK